MKAYMTRMVRGLILLVVVIAIVTFSIDYYVEQSTGKYIATADEVAGADAILVLGAYVFPDGKVSMMLYDRLSVAQEVYAKGKAGKIIVSGDHGQNDYDEVNAMKAFLKNEKVPSQDIFMDHAGFSTYESIYRARDIFKTKKIIIVTQEYHLFRALFIARALGLEAYGVPADKQYYGKQLMDTYRRREVAARVKDFFFATVLQPKPSLLGDEIPVIGNGDVTDNGK